MWLDSEDAGRVCRTSASYFQRLCRALGYRPDVYRGPGGKRNRWGGRHVLAVMLIPTLERLNVTTENATAVAQKIASGFSSDESLEAAFESGRSWLMLTGRPDGRIAVPELLFRRNIINAASQRKEALAALGVTLTGLDIGELWREIRAAAKVNVTEVE